MQINDMATFKRQCLALIRFTILVTIFSQDVTGKESSVSYNKDTGIVLFGSEDKGWTEIVVTELYQSCIVKDGIDPGCYPESALSSIQTSTTDQDCVKVEIESNRNEVDAGFCFDFGDSMWFGGSELQYQRWPIQKNITMPFQHYTTNDIVPSNETFGNVIERYWLNSKGVGIYVEEEVTLFGSIFDKSPGNDEPRMCLFARNQFQHLNLKLKQRINLHICLTENILQTHKLMSSRFFNTPNGHPDLRMMRSPIWSTWAKYKTEINEAKVLEYANEIVQHRFSNSQLEIDDMFSTHYGDFDFNPDKFSHPENMIVELKKLGFRVTVWITPFANLDSLAYTEGLKNGYWLKKIDGKEPAFVEWWQGTGAILDVDNTEAVNWYLGRLEEMKRKYGIDSFKFDAGELTFVPKEHQHVIKWNDPTMYTTKYVEAVSRMGPLIEVRCGYRTQSIPVFVRMGDKESRWGFDNGLKSLIPTILTMGLLGYPYILPDMIGGNGYVYGGEDNPFASTELPSRELYIRWLQVSAYMPAMQFSFVPWQYDEEVVEIARKFVAIHEDIVTPMLQEATKEAVDKGYPLIRPLWWIAPTDLYALESETQFLIGDSYLVAPILDEGAITRDVYLPEGLWEDELKGDTIKGGAWLRKYGIELDQVATFKRLRSKAVKSCTVK